MTLEKLAMEVVEAVESAGVEFMIVGAMAAGAYGVPRSTRDVDLLVSVNVEGGLASAMARLDSIVTFDAQVVFDTLTWGRRHVGHSRSAPPFKVELFEMIDDPFVRSEFSRRQRVFVPVLGRATWLPTPEDVIVQKLRWGRPKDLEDARDVLAVQGTDSLDMAYIEKWCAEHGTRTRLEAVLGGIPPT
jgi:hypothetical protein